jgi:hypothetical protein
MSKNPIQRKDEDKTVELDLRMTPLLRKVVESLVLTNADIHPTDNALAIAQGVGPHAPLIEHTRKDLQ